MAVRGGVQYDVRAIAVRYDAYVIINYAELNMIDVVRVVLG